MKLRWAKRSEIDDALWNQTIAQTPHSLPYAYTWYLDAVSESWSAVVADNYDAVLPLPYFSKLGIKYLYQPYFCQQLGLFFREQWNQQYADEMIQIALKKFPLVHYQLHTGCIGLKEKLKLSERKNLLLSLSPPYDRLKKQFSENHLRNVSKAAKASLVFVPDNPATDFERFYLTHVDRAKEKFSPKHEQHFKKLCSTLSINSITQFAAVKNDAGEWLAAVLLIHQPHRKIALINCSNTEGKKKGASHFLFSQLLAQFAAQKAVFDFEGSSIASIARFYEGFGAQPETYYLLKRHPLQRFGLKKHL